jgi:hypothetical protein
MLGHKLSKARQGLSRVQARQAAVGECEKFQQAKIAFAKRKIQSIDC